jgi:hypothetical protein
MLVRFLAKNSLAANKCMVVKSCYICIVVDGALYVYVCFLTEW